MSCIRQRQRGLRVKRWRRRSTCQAPLFCIQRRGRMKGYKQRPRLSPPLKRPARDRGLRVARRRPLCSRTAIDQSTHGAQNLWALKRWTLGTNPVQELAPCTCMKRLLIFCPFLPFLTVRRYLSGAASHCGATKRRFQFGAFFPIEPLTPSPCSSIPSENVQIK